MTLMPMKYLHEKTQPLTRVPWCVADGMTAGPILLYRGIKPVLFGPECDNYWIALT